jgi:Flp pilus assembly pilin Flp
MKRFTMRLRKEEEGQDAVEYMLLFALIALLVGATFPAFVALLYVRFLQ